MCQAALPLWEALPAAWLKEPKMIHCKRGGLTKGHQKSKQGGLPASFPSDGAPVLCAAPLSQVCWILPCKVMVKGPTLGPPRGPQCQLVKHSCLGTLHILTFSL